MTHVIGGRKDCDHQFVDSGNDLLDRAQNFLFGDPLKRKCIKCGGQVRA